MMVIVGNPELLVLDEYWADYLHFCLRNGAYTGCPLPDSILNTHTGNRENSTLIGRLEMNSFVSQFVDNLDRGRWLGGRTEIEEEGFIVVPTSSDSEDEDDEDGNGGDEGEDYQENEDDDGEFAPDMSFRSERNGHGLTGDDNEHGYGVDHGSSHTINGGNEGEEEDEGVRNAMEKLALGSLNMDDDTPVLSFSKSHAPQTHRPGHQGTASVASPQVHYGNKDHRGHSSSNNSINISNTGASWSYRNHPQAQAQMAPSPNMWPANAREFKRMSASKLVLERSFDPTEQDIFEDY